MTGLLLLANGFEDSEALTTRDVLLRAGIKIVTASISENLDVVSSHHLTVKADLLLNDIKDINNYDFIILPGGGLGVNNLIVSENVLNIVLEFNKTKKLIAAICAAPTILGKLGLLKGRKYTCFKGCEVGLEGNYQGTPTCVIDNIITARSMYYSVDFALEIIKFLFNEDKKLQIYESLLGNK